MIFGQSLIKYKFSERLINVDFDSFVCFCKTWLKFGSELDLSKITGIFSEVYFPAPYITRVFHMLNGQNVSHISF